MPLIDQIQKGHRRSHEGPRRARLSTLAHGSKDRGFKNKRDRQDGPRSTTRNRSRILSTLIKQRKRIGRAVHQGAGRQEMADKEAAEIKLIETYLPKRRPGRKRSWPECGQRLSRLTGPLTNEGHGAQ